jgi:Fe-S cluster biogenesis protein NfuA
MREPVKEKSELWDEVSSALDKIKPYLEADGGDVKILEITDDFIVRLELLGACGNCAMSEMTMKAGIEETIIRSVPEIKGVEAINSN